MAEIPSIQALEPLKHVIADLRKVDPGLDCTIDAFYFEVEKRALSRGWKHILLLDLPALGSVYDNGLSTGSLDFGKIPASFGKLNPGTFQDSWIYRTILQHTFDGFGTLDTTTPHEVVWATRQLLFLYKKGNFDCPQERVFDAVEDYIEIEAGLRQPGGSWNHDVWMGSSFSFSGSFSSELRGYGLTEQFWRICDLVFRQLVPRVWLLPEGVVPRHGPGAVSDVRTGGDKYAFPVWPAKLGRLFPAPQFAHANEYLAFTDVSGVGSSEKEPPARLLAVPKTFKGPRLIASEPTAHQYLQQGLMQWIRLNMPKALSTCVNFLDQTPSRVAALEASRTGEMATVDLSSASDRLSCWVVERAFSSNQSLLRALHATRTRVVEDGTGTHEGLSLRMKKFAAQGSAVTFPVQTIVYAGLAISSVLYDSGFRVGDLNVDNAWDEAQRCVLNAAKSVRVFGDDIVLPSPNVPTLAVALQASQLKVNGSKTHWNGRFRESCGMDAYCGHDVTPVYISDLLPKPSAEGLMSWIEISNLFHKSGLWQTAEWMLNQVDRKTLSSILYSDSSGAGIRAFTFCRGTRFHGPVRNHRAKVYGPLRPNEGMQYQERRVLCVSSRANRVARETFQSLLQYFLEKPDPELNWVSGYNSRKEAMTLSHSWVPYNS